MHRPHVSGGGIVGVGSEAAGLASGYLQRTGARRGRQLWRISPGHLTKAIVPFMFLRAILQVIVSTAARRIGTTADNGRPQGDTSQRPKRHIGRNKVTVQPAKATLSGRKATLLPVKLTDSAVLPLDTVTCVNRRALTGLPRRRSRAARFAGRRTRAPRAARPRPACAGWRSARRAPRGCPIAR